MGTFAEFLGENFSAVDFSGNVFDMDCEVLLLVFAEKVLLEVETVEAFCCCCCFIPITACKVFVVDNGGQGYVNHVKISDSVSERNGIFDAFIGGHNF